MLLLLLPLKEYVIRLVELRSIVDIVLVFLVVYGVLKLLRGTRAALPYDRPRSAQFPAARNIFSETVRNLNQNSGS